MPSEHVTWAGAGVGPGSVTLAQHWTGIGIASRVSWSVLS